jgi:hypothetical protein
MIKLHVWTIQIGNIAFGHYVKLHVTCITFVDYGGVESWTKDCAIFGEHEW